MLIADRHRATLVGFLIASTTTAIVALCWLCLRSPEIAFLPARAGADWIVYPRSPEGTTQKPVPVSAVFRRDLTLDAPPAKTVLTHCAFRAVEVFINDRAVPIPSTASAGWKSPTTVDVTGFLHQGTNILTARVTNTLGPPALWLRLQSDQESWATDKNWQVSLAGGMWRTARLATEAPEIQPGNPLYGSERVPESVKRVWPVLTAVSVVLLALLSFIERWSRRRKQLGWSGPTFSLKQSGYIVLAVVLIARVALFIHDLPHLPRSMGFDARGHEQYIEFIQEKHALPLPQDGWEMHQPPLYYAGSAMLLGLGKLSVTDDDATLLLRIVNNLLGLIHCWLALLCLQLLFPANLLAQVVGLLVAAFLPPHLYLSQYVTNEPLAGLFVTLAFYLCLRAWPARRASLWLYVAIGAALGAGMLTKFSSLLALLCFPVAFGLQLVSAKCYATLEWLRRPGLVILACVLVCGWQQGRLAQFGGGMLPGSEIDPSSSWWQDPGFRTSTFYYSSGQALVSPLFSALHGFLDGIYSTLWGDGLISGRVRLASRPPWNYDLMNTAYLLALGPSLLLVVGLMIALARFIRQASPEWFVVIGMVGLFGLGILYMSLRIPAHSEVKAFFAFPALVPFSALVALGWDWLQQKHRVIRIALGVILLVWVMTVYAAFWIRNGDPQSQLARGLYLSEQQRDSEAAESLSLALQMNKAIAGASGIPLPQTCIADAHFALAMILERQGNVTEAIRHYRAALGFQPDHAVALNNLAWILATNPQDELRDGNEAVRLAVRACKATDNQISTFIGTLAAAYAEAGRFEEAIATAELASACARAWHEEAIAERNQQLLELYRARQPAREGK